MRKFYWSFLTIMMVVFMGVNLVSCSDDDGNKNGSSIVGNWIREYIEEAEYGDYKYFYCTRSLFSLREDGTFRFEEEEIEASSYNSSSSNSSFSGVYEYTDNILKIYITKSSDPYEYPIGSSFVLIIQSLTKNTFHLYGDELADYTRTSKTTLW